MGDRVVCVSDDKAFYVNKPTIGKIYRIRKFPYIENIFEKNWAIMDGSGIENYHLDDFVPYKKVLLKELLKDE